LKSPTHKTHNTMNYTALDNAPRLLMEAELTPLQGHRFQPTGFADLGAARYKAPDGTDMLLVESAQSVANRLENTIWDEAREDVIQELQGLPYIRIDCGDLGKTSSIKEFHRLNSPYIWKSKENDTNESFQRAFMADMGLRLAQKRKKKGEKKSEEDEIPGTFDLRKFTRTVFKWDPNSILHGLFLEKVAGRLRMMRALSGFIEASNVSVAESGGVKVDNILPSPKSLGLATDEGFGNVPFHRSEFTAQRITAYFNLDLALLRGYGLPGEATKLLVALALFKVRRFLASGLRLRTACDFAVVGDLKVTRPEGFAIPLEENLLAETRAHLEACGNIGGLFAEPSVTEVKWEPAKKKQAKKNADEDSKENEESK
jgi:CRISPR-associated protein Csb1